MIMSGDFLEFLEDDRSDIIALYETRSGMGRGAEPEARRVG